MKQAPWMARTAAALIGGIATLPALQNPAYAQSADQHHRDMVDIAATPPQYGDQGERDEDSAPDRPRLRSKPGFMATAYHADTGSVWTSVAHRTLDAARKRALSGCNAATGGGCYIVASIGGLGRTSVTEDAMGQLWAKGAVGDEMLAPVDVSMEFCLRYSFGCKFLGYHDSGSIFLDEDPSLDQSQDRFPKGQLHWNRWALVVRPSGQGKSWLISGRENSAAARKEILDRCRADSGMPCTVSAYAAHDTEMVARETKVGNGLLVHYLDSTGRNFWTSAVTESGGRSRRNQSDPIAAEARVGRLCPPAQRCRIIGTYDAATPRLIVVPDVP